MGNNVVFQSNLVMVQRQALQNFASAAKELESESVEWVQEQMLYGYHTPHGADGHTEIYDTGALIDSLKGKVTRDSQNTFTVTVGTDKDYAEFVHNGTYKLGARPFISDGLQKNRNKIESIIAKHAKEGF